MTSYCIESYSAIEEFSVLVAGHPIVFFNLTTPNVKFNNYMIMLGNEVSSPPTPFVQQG